MTEDDRQIPRRARIRVGRWAYTCTPAPSEANPNGNAEFRCVCEDVTLDSAESKKPAKFALTQTVDFGQVRVTVRP